VIGSFADAASPKASDQQSRANQKDDGKCNLGHNERGPRPVLTYAVSSTARTAPFNPRFRIDRRSLEAGVTPKSAPVTLQQHRADDREDGEVCADTERQREQRDGDECRSPPERPHGIADVLHQTFRSPPRQRGVPAR
jgi:hypothetical protein